jgi:anaerobic magnesium-protoporphyrin IX monomethyl ester cyclase
MKKSIIFFNPPFNREKPDYMTDASLARFEMDAINPGLLSMASFLRTQGISAEIYDFYRQKDIVSVEKGVAEIIGSENPSVVGISNLSAYDYLDSLNIARVVKQTNPNTKVIVGGQHASGLKSQVLIDEPSIDGLVEGEGEKPILDIFQRVITGKNLVGAPNLWIRRDKGEILAPTEYHNPLNLDQIPLLDFAIYPEALSFTPFIEEARGCHLSCDYCNNVFFYGQNARSKSAEKFARDIENTISFFGKEPLYAIMTPNFRFRGSSEKLALLKRAGIRWSSEVSCDMPWFRSISEFAESGMFLLNVGLESASPNTLRRMNKVANPEKYLSNAQRILEEAQKYESLKTRFNIMIYPGDTYEDVEHTRQFLEANISKLDAVVCCPTIAYPGSRLFDQLQRIQELYGASVFVSPFCESTHHYPIHPSPDLTFQEASELCLRLEEEFSPARLLSLKHNYKKYEGNF